MTPEVEEAILKQAQAPEILRQRELIIYDHAEVGRDYIRMGLSLEEFTRVLVVN